jgi:hypothetical protein
VGVNWAFRDLSPSIHLSIYPSIHLSIYPSIGSLAQLTEISKIIYRRLFTSIAPNGMVLTVNLTVNFFSVFCFGILPSSQYAERARAYK